MKKIRWLSLPAMLCVLLSGCSIVSIDSANLLYPPRPAGEQAEIQQALEQHIGTRFTLKYPRSGELRSAITREDCDGDGDDEVIVFYRPVTETGGVHFALMDEVDGKWQVKNDLVGPGVDVERIVITNFGNDDRISILIGWSLYNRDKIGTVYTYRDGKVVNSLMDHAYTEMVVDDFDGDGRDELFTLLLNTSDQTSSARLLEQNEDSGLMQVVSQVELDGNISSYARVRFGQVDVGGAVGVVIDEYKSATTMKTEIVYWDAQSGQLKAPVFSEDQPGQNMGLIRESTTLSSDLSGNGVIDIPFLHYVYRNIFDEVQTGQSVRMENAFTRWREYDASKNSFVNVLDTAINYSDGYYLVIPEECNWLQRSYFTLENETRRMQFNDLQNDWSMFTISVFSESEWEKTGKDKCFEVTRANGIVYGCWVSARIQSELGGKEEEFFRKNFHLING